MIMFIAARFEEKDRAVGALNKIIADGLENKTVIFFNESDFGASADRIFSAKPRRNYYAASTTDC